METSSNLVKVGVLAGILYVCYTFGNMVIGHPNASANDLGFAKAQERVQSALAATAAAETKYATASPAQRQHALAPLLSTAHLALANAEGWRKISAAEHEREVRVQTVESACNFGVALLYVGLLIALMIRKPVPPAVEVAQALAA